MAPAWQKRWSRLTEMTGGEIRSRVSQEFWRQLDLALYRTGLVPRAPRLRPQPAEQAKFFFRKNDVAHRAELLRTHLPREADAIIHEADDICRHEFRLLGHEKLDYGPNIDWHFSRHHAHGKDSSIEPWFNINFLDYCVVGDHKIIWELNRHQHLVMLAKAWLLTGEAAYTDELVAQWNSWQKANPYPLGINWASTLEIAFRSLSWLWVRNLLADCPHLPATFHANLLLALQSHGRYIERYLSTYFSPNTHLIGEAVALFFIGTLCPEIAASERWRSKGWSIVLGESEQQVLPDGVYFEQALYYHVYALDFFLHARILADKNGFQIPGQFDNVLKKMLDVVQALSAVGPIESFGDDDGGRVFNPRRNRTEYMTDPLALGAILYDCDKYAAAALTEEAIWLFGDEAVQALGKPRGRLAPSSQAFVSGGIYLINDYAPYPQQMLIDAGPQGAGRAGHGHADALSIRFSLAGQRFLVDPGTYCYISGGNERGEFRGTGTHNTLRVDKLDQAIAEGPFAWSSLPQVKTETWLNGQTFDFFAASHNGYRRLANPVLHRRYVFHVKGGFWFVRDVAEGEGRHLLESFWHFAPNLEVAEEGGMILAKSLATDSGRQRADLALLIDRSSEWTTEITQGFVSRAYGSKQAAPVLCLRRSAAMPEDSAVLLAPVTQAAEAGVFSAFGENSDRGVRGYRYQTPQVTEFLFIGARNSAWTCGPWSSNSELLYCKLENGRFRHVIMVAGSFAEWRGKRFVSRPPQTETFEWMSRAGSGKAFSSEGKVMEDSAITDFEIFDSVS